MEHINKRQQHIVKVLKDDGFVDDKDPRIEKKRYQAVLTRKLRNNDVLRVVLDSEGEENDTQMEAFVFSSGYGEGFPLAYSAKFSFQTPLQAFYNYLQTLG